MIEMIERGNPDDTHECPTSHHAVSGTLVGLDSWGSLVLAFSLECSRLMSRAGGEGKVMPAPIKWAEKAATDFHSVPQDQRQRGQLAKLTGTPTQGQSGNNGRVRHIVRIDRPPGLA